MKVIKWIFIVFIILLPISLMPEKYRIAFMGLGLLAGFMLLLFSSKAGK